MEMYFFSEGLAFALVETVSVLCVCVVSANNPFLKKWEKHRYSLSLSRKDDRVFVAAVLLLL
jgi:hypothetical protein